jgi:hypothetical protein
MIEENAVEKAPGLNFLTPEIADYMEKRIPEVKRAQGAFDEDRLRRNLLSSIALAFNIFGFLRAVPKVAAPVLRDLLGLDVAEITNVEVEWAPLPVTKYLDDRTAFDTFIEYRRSDKAKAFIGVETKYTEPFSETVYDKATYRTLTEDPSSGFKVDAHHHLTGVETNLLWRNALLMLSLKKTDGYEDGHVLVLACREDPGAKKAVNGLREQLVNPDALLRHLALEDLIAAFRKVPETANWALAFERRYLDLTPVTAVRR